MPEQLRADLRAAHSRILRFAQAQLGALTMDIEVELEPGVTAGSRRLPVSAAGCYVPGGRYAHLASALMTVTTAKAAGVPYVVMCTPPSSARATGAATDERNLEALVPSELRFAAHLAGADVLLVCGGVQGIAAMVEGIGIEHKVDVVVGPGNRFVAEAKRQLFGRIGIDMIAGPTETLIVADGTADAHLVSSDLVSQAEHGPDSPCWLVTTSEALAKDVMARMQGHMDRLPEVNKAAAEAAWADYGEVVLAADRDEAAAICDEYAAEHLEVHCADLAWWKTTLRNYGSLFLGEETTVTYGDKAAGPNHVLPTMGAARYTGGLNVDKFLKTVTWQQMTREATRTVGAESARISRAEGMVGHAHAAEDRLAKFC